MAVVHNVPCKEGPACWLCFRRYYCIWPAHMIKEWFDKYHKGKDYAEKYYEK